MSIVLVGSTSGSVTLQEPAVAGTTVITLPSTSGTLLQSGTAVTPAQGGIGATATPANGQIPIGNGTNYTPATLTAGTGISVTNGAGSISIASTATSAVIQVKSTTKTDIFSSTSTSFTDVTGLSISITPTSASNKILVFMTLTCGSDTATVLVAFRLMRDSTAIDIGDAAGSRTQATGGAGRVNDVSDTYSINGVFLDSPATTSATTYKVQMMNNNGNTAFVGSNGLNADNPATGRYPSTITVMEVTP